ncbi:MAG: ABC transporter substrate-binding protein [Planctomycetaceae bacterium]|nr:ABC transporter substrate-binding protein [Planctomycetaceae bacterium]
MTWRWNCAGIWICGFGLLLFSGCGESAAPNNSSPAASTPTEDAPTGKEAPAAAEQTEWPGYPDVPYVPIMTEVDGIKIPRVDLPVEQAAGGAIPLDKGNADAAGKPSEPVNGDWVIVRFSAEPQSLNPIVETSAVQQYITQYTADGLLRQHWETLEWEPHMAHKYLAEDSIKLSPTYPGFERGIARTSDGTPAGELELVVEKSDESFEFVTFGSDQKPMSGVWVGVFADGKILGAAVNGYHDWSREEGKVKFQGLPPGKYKVKVGHEIAGDAKKLEEGALEVSLSPDSANNPLADFLKSKEMESLKLAAGEWVDLQEDTIYTYFLRDDLTWSDGAPFKARDVVFTFNTINNTTVDGDSLRVYYQDLVRCEEVDPLTVRMQYRQQYFLALEFTCTITAYSPPRHVFEAQFKKDGLELTDERLTPEQEKEQKKVSVHGQAYGQFFNKNSEYGEKPLGTGAYIVGDWSRGNRVELNRNENYWNKKLAGHLDKLIFRFIPDQVTALQALKSGEIDFDFPLTAEQYFEEIEQPVEKEWVERSYVKADWYIPSYGYCGWNMLKPIFQDRRVRIALSMMFDKKDYWEKKMHKAAMIVSGSQYYFGPGYDHEVKPIGFDTTGAIDLLAEAGWIDSNGDGVLDKDGKKFEFELLFPPGSPAAEARALVMQKTYKEAGIIMNVRHLEWASFLDKIKNKDFEACFLGWVQNLESDPYQLWHSSGAGPEARGSNHCSFANPVADQLIDLIRLTLDEKKRQKAHFTMHRILDREQPYMFMYAPKEMALYHKRFRGVKWYVLRPGFDLSEWYVPKDLQLRGQN